MMLPNQDISYWNKDASESTYHQLSQNLEVDVAIVGGESHVPWFTGIRSKPRYNRLAEYADDRLGITSLSYKWSTMDYISYDDIPLVGRLYPWTKHVFVITAFKKWGLTSSVVAATLIKNLVLREKSPLEKVYNSNRLSPVTSMPKVYANHIKQLIK